MGINKIQYGNNVLIDLTNDTVTAQKIISGYTAHDRNGEIITGVAAGDSIVLNTMEEFISNYDDEEGFLLSYDNATTGTQYVTNTVNTSNGIYEENASISSASSWYFEQISGYTDRYYIYTKINNENYYMYNNTSSGANFMGLSTTTKSSFTVSLAVEGKFYFKLSSGNKWLQHSNSGGGIRLYTDNKSAANSQFTITYKTNAIIPYGTLTITENGTYNITNYKTIIVNISNSGSTSTINGDEVSY